MKPFTLLLETADLLAVDKPEGVTSIPGRGADEVCLLTELSVRYPEKLYVVHRLDKDVSGVILFARHAEAHRHLNAQFSRRSVRKTYVALVHGVVADEHRVIDVPLRAFGSGRMGIDEQRGKPSTTTLHVTERLADATLVTLHPLTGRRHQLRVHAYGIGHPIVGDPRYGDPAVQQGYPRLMLHARSITVRLLSGDSLTVEAPVPASFQAVVEAMKGRGDAMRSSRA